MAEQWRHPVVPRRRKHEPIPSLSNQEIREKTRDDWSRFYHGADADRLEQIAIRDGVDVPCAKGATVVKVHEFDFVIGASRGEDSRWIWVESTSGVYHGYPITKGEYQRALAKVGGAQ